MDEKTVKKYVELLLKYVLYLLVFIARNVAKTRKDLATLERFGENMTKELEELDVKW